MALELNDELEMARREDEASYHGAAVLTTVLVSLFTAIVGFVVGLAVGVYI